MNNSLCAHYKEETGQCDQKKCTQGHLCKDGSCDSSGEIYDKYKSRNVTNFEYKRNYTEQ